MREVIDGTETAAQRAQQPGHGMEWAQRDIATVWVERNDSRDRKADAQQPSRGGTETSASPAKGHACAGDGAHCGLDGMTTD